MGSDKTVSCLLASCACLLMGCDAQETSTADSSQSSKTRCETMYAIQAYSPIGWGSTKSGGVPYGTPVTVCASDGDNIRITTGDGVFSAKAWERSKFSTQSPLDDYPPINVPSDLVGEWRFFPEVSKSDGHNLVDAALVRNTPMEPYFGRIRFNCGDMTSQILKEGTGINDAVTNYIPDGQQVEDSPSRLQEGSTMYWLAAHVCNVRQFVKN